MQEKGPALALVLGGGGARGYAHLGVLRVLLEAGIKPGLVVGSSFGAIVGAAWAAGRYSLEDLYTLALCMNRRRALSLCDPVWPREGLIRGRRLEEFLHTLTGGVSFPELRHPLAVVATDLERGETVVLQEGPVARAVLASSALPGLMAPVRWGERALFDGCLLSPLPVAEALALGAQRVLAVDVSSPVDGTDQLHALVYRVRRWGSRVRAVARRHEVTFRLYTRASQMWPPSLRALARSCTLSEEKRSCCPPALLQERVTVWRPAVQGVAWNEFHRAAECIAAGEAVAREALRNWHGEAMLH
ncbi:MAG: patatin-like phospholipase family protein [Bacillota bacterium]|nr:patatin-like phospholipase family protein [Bacillota bacterium]